MDQAVLAALIIGAAVVAPVAVPRMSRSGATRGGWLRHPGLWLGVVVALLFVNQVLFTAYVDTTWGGDPTPIARYLPAGWFDMADLGPVVAGLPAWSATVLRVPAALELPFVMLAYLLVCRWFGSEIVARFLGARWLVSVSYTLTFCLIELDLRTPYTFADIVIRVVAGVVTPMLLPLCSGGSGSGPPRPVPFVLSAGALGVLVLAVYDTATLYSLGRVPGWIPLCVGAAITLAVARRWALRATVLRPVTASADRSLGWFLALFAVAALPLRYGFTFGAAGVSMAAGVVTVASALYRGWDRLLIPQLVIAVVAGCGGAVGGYVLARGYPETKLLAAAAGFAMVAAMVCAALDRRVTRRALPGPDEDHCGVDDHRGQ